MGTYVVKNPLTLEERLSVIELIAHDLISVHQNLNSMISRAKNTPINPIARYLSQHIADVAASLTIFKIDHYVPQTIQYPDLVETLERLAGILKFRDTNLTYGVDESITFDSGMPLIYTALYNLAKNSARMLEPCTGLVQVKVSKFDGEVPTPVYKNPETQTAGKFIKIEIQDNGTGFPQDIDLGGFLEHRFSTRGKEHGFGLYYVALVCKFLRSHLVIDSKPGDTSVSIYHPVNLK